MAAAGDVGGGSASNFSVFRRSQRGPSAAASLQPLDAFVLSGLSPPFLASRSMVIFEDVNNGVSGSAGPFLRMLIMDVNNGVSGSARPFFRTFDHDGNLDDELDEYFHQPEKKRRLTLEQVKFLERSFEVENMLEPNRKTQLAKDLGLQPRQVAVWFQNRRARWKTKQLEKDYDALQASYNSLKADYESLLKEKDKLKAEVDLLAEKLLLNEKGKGNSESSDNDTLSQEPQRKQIVDLASEGVVSKLSIVKQEDISSAKSDIFDSSDSPHYTDGIHSPLLEAGDHSYVQSDLSQDEDDNLSKRLLPPCVFPKLEDADYSHPPPAIFEDHALWSWSY